MKGVPVSASRFIKALPPSVLMTAALVVSAGGAVGALLRSLAVEIHAPHQHRQAESYSVAYNFIHESPNFFLPRHDWCDELSGITGMEAPIYSYLGAIFMRIFGEGAVVMRSLSFVALVASLVFAVRMMARERSRVEAGAFVSVFVLAPATLTEFRQIQPDGAMAALALIASYFGWKYAREERPADLAWAALMFGLALLTKPFVLCIAPAIVMFSISPSPRRLLFPDYLLRAAAFGCALLPWLAWDRWAHHLIDHYALGRIAFTINFDIYEILRDLKNEYNLRHIFFSLLPRYSIAWCFWPMAVAALGIAWDARRRALTLPFALWLAGSGAMCAAFSWRPISHWYYSILFIAPLAYFASLSLGAVMETFDAWRTGRTTSRPVRWVAIVVLVACAASVLYLESKSTPVAISATGMPKEDAWTGEYGTLRLVAIAVVAAGWVISTRGRPFWGSPILIAGGIALVAAVGWRGLKDSREFLTLISDQKGWSTARTDTKTVRAMVARHSTRADRFVTNSGTPHALYVPLRRGWAVDNWVIDRAGGDYFTSRGARFYLHWRSAAVPAAFQKAPIVDQTGTAVLYCIDPAGCAGGPT